MKAFYCTLFFLIPSLILSQTKQAPYEISRPLNATIIADSIDPDTTGMGNLTSVELSQLMIPGWNVGNSLEATGGETSWGNPLITQQLMDSVAAAGFKCVRIPVAWSYQMDSTVPNTYIISPTRLARVAQVVDYILNAGMYAIINEHWDGGWMLPTYAQQTYVNNRFRLMWLQIATYFRDYDYRLLFAGMNEVKYDYSNPTAEHRTVHNSYCQNFISTVRSTGGKNYYRYLLVQGYNTNIDHTYNYLVIPTDPTPNRIMIEVHYYDPYNFTLNGSSTITQWGKYATVPARTETWANESWADGQFQKMKTKFINTGYGVILGEYCAMRRTDLGSLNAEHAWYRRYWHQYITLSLERHGLVPVYWDAGYTGNDGSGIFNRSNGTKADTDIINAVIDTTSIISSGVGDNLTETRPESYALRQNYPNPFNPATTISFDLPKKSFVTLKIFNILGMEVASLISQNMPAGTYTRRWAAADLPSGIYYYQLHAGDYTETKKLVLLK